MRNRWWLVFNRPARRSFVPRCFALRPELEELETRVVPSGTWTPLTNQLPDPYGGETMILLTNGTVMVQGGGGGMSNAWYQLTPDASGNYINGSWSTLASMNTMRLYYGSQVLPNGNVVVIGGEYTGPDADRTLTNTGEIYNPTANTWTPIAPDPYVSQLGDVSTMLLPDGNILVGDKLTTETDIYDPGTNTWSQGGTRLYSDINDEESWVKLPDNNIVSYDIWSSQTNGVGQSQIYNPVTNQWVDAGTVPVILSTSGTDNEMGPCLRLPDGRAFFIGSNGNTALYTESTNSWVAGPTMPGGYVSDDAPGALTPDGQVIFGADQGDYDNPSAVFDYDPSSNTITQLSVPDGNLANNPSFVDRMLVLPSGQVLFCDSSDQLLVYTPSGTAQSSWQPVVTGITQNNGVYTLTGTGLNGVSAGAVYGDDAQMDENFPIINLTSASGQVYYATTSNWSYTGVGPGTQETVNFTLPAGMPTGTYTLKDIGAGIASSGTLFNALTLTSFTPPTNAVEGASTGGTLATFTDANTSPNINTYTAVVTWGDGDVDTLTAANGGIVSNGGNSFKVVDTHTYAEESPGENFSVQITDQSGSDIVKSATVVVADAPLTATPVTLNVGVNAPITGATVATFTDANPNATVSDYSATVNWGDGGSTASVSIIADPHVAKQFDVIASKSTPYAAAGTFPITVVIHDVGGSTATANSKAIVSSPTITVTGTSISSTEGAAFSGDVATFVDTNKNEPVTYYTATINWGDGSTSAGTIAAGTTKGHFKVSGTHTYAEEGTYTAVVTVTEMTGAFAQADTTAKVKDAALSGSATNFSAAKNAAFSGQVATFTDANPYATLSDYSATVGWGDGHSSTATVSTNPSGGFQVQGSHTYTKTGIFTVTVTITDIGGSKLTLKGTATVGTSPVVVGGGPGPAITGANGASASDPSNGSTPLGVALPAGSSTTATSSSASTSAVAPATVTEALALNQETPIVSSEEDTGWLSL